jgi:hypothetical protein
MADFLLGSYGVVAVRRFASNAGELLNSPNHRRGSQMDEPPLSSSNLSATAITAIASATLLAFAGGFATAWLLEQYLNQRSLTGIIRACAGASTKAGE